MATTKHTESQMMEALKQLEAGRRAEDVALEMGVSEHTIEVWKKTFKLTKPKTVTTLCCRACGNANLILDKSRDILVCSVCGAND